MKLAILDVASVVLVFGGLSAWARLNRAMRVAWYIGVTIALAAFLRVFFHIIHESLQQPPVWDFLCFWVYGRIALTSHALYDPASFHAVGDTLTFVPSWTQEVLNVGFIYPPPAILLFAPLGLFATPIAAAPLWYAELILETVLLIVVLGGILFPEDRLAGVLGAALLVLALPATRITILTAQTDVLLLLLITLFAVDKNNGRRGVWLGAAIIVKPVAIIVLLYPLIRRAWAIIAGAIGTLLIATIAAALLIGVNNVLAYFSSSPYPRYPGEAYLAGINQSLFAMILRLTHQHAAHYSLWHEPIFVIVGLALGAITIWLCLRDASSDSDLCIGLIISFALLVYPGSLVPYGILLLLPIVWLWRRYNRTQAALVITFAVLQYLLTLEPLAFRGFGTAAWFMSWFVFAGILVAIQRGARAPDIAQALSTGQARTVSSSSPRT